MAAAASIPKGAAVKLNSAAQTAPGQVGSFAFQARPDGGDFSASFQAVGTVTTLTSALQVSLDGGTTWGDYIASANFISNATPAKVITPVVAGALYRLNNTALTGSQDFWVSAN